jgi:hypothetical protein
MLVVGPRLEAVVVAQQVVAMQVSKVAQLASQLEFEGTSFVTTLRFSSAAVYGMASQTCEPGL